MVNMCESEKVSKVSWLRVCLNNHVDDMGWRKITVLAVIFLLIALGGKARILGAFLTVLLSLLQIIEWEYFFYSGLVLTPVKTLGGIDVGFNLQLSHLFLLSAIIGAIMDRQFHLDFKPGRFDYRIVIGVLVLVVSSFQSIYLPNDPLVIRGAFRNYPWLKSLGRIWFISLLIVLAFFVRAYIFDKDRLFKIFRVLIVSSSVYSLIGFLFFMLLLFFGVITVFGISGVSYTANETHRISVFEWEPLYFGSYLLTITPIVIALIIRKNYVILNRSIVWFICVLNVLGIFLTFSRGAWAGFVASMFFLAVLNYKFVFIKLLINFKKKSAALAFFIRNNRQVSMVVMSFFLVMAVLFLRDGVVQGLYSLFIEPVVGVFDQNSGKFWSTRVRLMTVRIGLDAFLKHPFLGIGFENFSFYSGNILIHDLVDSIINYSEVNSLPFRILIETGLLGFIVIGWILSKSFIDLVVVTKRVKDGAVKALLEGCCAAVVGVGVHSLFFSNFLSTYLWVLLGVILAAVDIGENKSGG